MGNVAVRSVGNARYKLDALCFAESEGGLEAQRHRDMRIPHFFKNVRIEHLTFIPDGVPQPRRYAVGRIILVHHVRPADSPRPPPQIGEPILDCHVGDTPLPPEGDEGVDVFGFQRARFEMTVPKLIELFRHHGQSPRPLLPGRMRPGEVSDDTALLIAN